MARGQFHLASALIHWYTYQLYNTVIKLVGNSVQEFGGICRRSALAGGKRVFEDLIQKKRVFEDLNHEILVFLN